MLQNLGMSVFKLIQTAGHILAQLTNHSTAAVLAEAREAELAFEPIKNCLILLPLPLIILTALVVSLIRSFRKPERVLKSSVTEQLEARGRSTRGYLRFWRIEVLLTIVFVVAFAAFIVTSMTLGAIDGYTPADDAIKAQNGFFMYAIIAYAIVLGLVAYVGRGYFFGKWGVRFIAITQGGPPNPRSGSGYTM